MANKHELYIIIHSNESKTVQISVFFLAVTAEALQLEGTLHEKEGAHLKPNTDLYNTV